MPHDLARIQMAGWDAQTGHPLYYVICECNWMSESQKAYGQFLDTKTTIRIMDSHRKEMQ